MTKETAEKIRGAEFIVMEDIGHFPMSENYPVFKRYLEQALESIESRLAAPHTGNGRTPEVHQPA